MNFYFQTTSESEYAFGFGQTEKTYIERQKNSDYTKVVTKDILFGHAQWRDQNFWVGYSYRDTEVDVLKKDSGSTLASQVVTEVDRKSQEVILEVLLPTCDELDIALLVIPNPPILPVVAVTVPVSVALVAVISDATKSA